MRKFGFEIKPRRARSDLYMSRDHYNLKSTSLFGIFLQLLKIRKTKLLILIGQQTLNLRCGNVGGKESLDSHFHATIQRLTSKEIP